MRYKTTPRIMTILLSLSLLVMLVRPINAQQQAGPTAPTKAADKNQSTALDNTSHMTDINNIKPPEQIGFNPALLWYAISGLILLALLAGLLLYLKKRRKKAIPEVFAAVSPDEAAFNAINALQDLMHTNGKQFYFQLSMILREYIGQRFSVGAQEMTTEELLPKIAEIELPRDLDLGVRNFVRASDPVKFAGRPPEIEIMQRHLEFVTDFVRKTTPASTDETEITATDKETNP